MLATPQKQEQRQPEPQPASPILSLPTELVFEVLDRLAKEDYYSVKLLAGTCSQLRKICKHFMETHPPEQYMPPHRVAGDSDSDDGASFCSIDYHDNSAYDSDNIDYLAQDMQDRLSWGSGYDSEAHNLVQ